MEGRERSWRRRHGEMAYLVEGEDGGDEEEEAEGGADDGPAGKDVEEEGAEHL